MDNSKYYKLEKVLMPLAESIYGPVLYATILVTEINFKEAFAAKLQGKVIYSSREEAKKQLRLKQSRRLSRNTDVFHKQKLSKS